MTPEYLQLGGAVVVTLSAFKLIEFIVGKLSPKYGIYGSKTELKLSELTGKFVNLENLVTEIKTNHITHLDAKIDRVVAEVGDLKIGLTRLETIINERIPFKK